MPLKPYVSFAEDKEEEDISELNFDAETIDKYRAIFNLVDLDGSGDIDMDELVDLMAWMGLNISESSKMMHDIDADGDGSVTFPEFISAMSSFTKQSNSKGDVLAAFKAFAVDSAEGCVNIESLSEALIEYGPPDIPEEELRQLVGRLETDASGQLDLRTGQFNYSQFVNLQNMK